MPDTHGIGSFVPISAAEITDEIWTEIARQHAGAAPMRAAAEKARVASSPVSMPAPIPAALPLPALLALSGQAFIDAAYATVLGRAPDETGTAYVTAALARGVGKLDVLGELHASPEGRQSGRIVQGLRRRSLLRLLCRLPVLGRAARFVTVLVRRNRVAGGQLDVALRAELDSRLGMVETALDTRRRALEERVAELQLAVELATRRVALVQASHEEMRHKALTALSEQGRHLARLDEQGVGFTRQLAATEDSVIDSLLAVADGVSSHGRRLATIEAGVDLPAIAERIDGAAHGLRAELDGRVIAAETLVARNRQDVVDQQRRIGLMLNALRDRVPAVVDAEDDHALDGLYLEFEDRFRGTRADIKQRQRAYLPRLRDAGIGSPDRPVLDIGAGRGEFLELLRDEGLSARGVDANVTMAALCREAGLDCVEADALTYLAAQPGESLGAVTGFHIVEHLPFKVMVRVLDEALRVLSPGGLIIFETPNPANILTASRNFYLDPTHRNPLPGEMMAMIAEARGFADAEIVELHPMTARFPGTDRVLATALDRIFHGPQDYALIARRA